METLNAEESQEFLERFYNCGDGVIRSVTFFFRSGVETAKVSVVISTRDRDSTVNEGWVNLRLELHDVEELSCHESPRGSYQVLSTALYIGHFDDLLFLDFGGGVPDPQSIEEFRRSKFYFAGRSLSWEVLPYDASHAQQEK
jgi:hypothetical protein